MANFYIPSQKALENITSLLQGFWLELDENKNPVLLLKLEASVSDSVIKGDSIEIVLRNPSLDKRSCTLYIHDIPNDPFYVTWNNFGEEDKFLKGFDDVAITLVKSSNIKVVFYNELSHQFFSTDLEIKPRVKDFEDWLFNIYNNSNYQNLKKSEVEGHYFPENELKGFKVDIINKNNSKEEKFGIIADEYKEEWQQNPSIDKYFNYDNFIGDGKHGYFQEFSITSFLSNFFIPEIDFFVSPKYVNEDEFTDFILIYNKVAMVIESKYIISNKQTKKHSAIVKAIDQLNKVEQIILDKKVNLINSELTEILNKVEIINKVCLVNSKTIVSETNFKGIVNNYTKRELPLFISVTVFFEIIATLKIKNEDFLMQNLMMNFLNFRDIFLNSNDRILYIRDSNFMGLSISEINKLGSSNRIL